MSAARLREAAVLMRERADAADPGPWECYGAHLGGVADWLDETARRWEWVEERELALAVANAYLGDPS